MFGSPASVKDGIALQASPIQPSPVYGGGESAVSGGEGGLGLRQGRDGYNPGDRTWWKLPLLPEPTEADACILASDWLTQVQPIMGDLSDKSSIWWSQVMRVAQDAYANWQRAGPLEKSFVVCDLPLELQDARYARLESRALGMLLESLPSRVKDELVVTRGMTCANAIFRVLLAYQPGGLAERQRLIQHLTDPGQAHTAKECSDCLRKWNRWLTRSQDLSVSRPDAAVLLAGLDKLCQVVMDAHAQLSFRCSISRTQHQLFFAPHCSPSPLMPDCCKLRWRLCHCLELMVILTTLRRRAGSLSFKRVERMAPKMETQHLGEKGQNLLLLTPLRTTVPRVRVKESAGSSLIRVAVVMAAPVLQSMIKPKRLR